jgi:hypothetical protein
MAKSDYGRILIMQARRRFDFTTVRAIAGVEGARKLDFDGELGVEDT